MKITYLNEKVNWLMVICILAFIFIISLIISIHHNTDIKIDYSKCEEVEEFVWEKCKIDSRNVDCNNFNINESKRSTSRSGGMRTYYKCDEVYILK